MSTKDEQFRAIYMHYMPLMRIIARKKKIPEAEIDDLVQETFVAYYSHYPLDWTDPQIKAALAKIMRNRCIDYFRKRDNWLLTYYDPVSIQERLFSEEERFGRDNLSVYLEHQECEEVLNALGCMKKDWAQVFLLYMIEGRPMTEVSEKLGRGRHTTRHVELFRLSCGALAADTPGFSSFDVDKMELARKEELQYAFREFAPCLGRCRFQDCAHVREKGCAVLEAVRSGEIPETRHRSYVRLYEQAKAIPDWQRKEI